MNFFNFAVDNDKKQDNSYAAAPTPDRLKRNARVLILAADDVQDLEFFYPYYRLSEEGYEVDVATPDGKGFTGKKGMGLDTVKAISEVQEEDYALLYIPGGKAPEELRKNEQVLRIVKDFAEAGKPIASICHGAQVLASADIIEGKRIAAWPEIKDEVEEAGATFVDEALVEDGQFITARKPGDLPRHLSGTLDKLRQQEAMEVDVDEAYPTAARTGTRAWR